MLSLLKWRPWRRKPREEDSGRWGEGVAEKFLRRKGYRILGRRVRFGRRIELDLVARDRVFLVFVEVKTRRSEVFGRPASAVNRKKRLLMAKGALRYLNKIGNPPIYFRFDVIEVIGRPGTEARVRHLESVFPVPRPYRAPI